MATHPHRLQDVSSVACAILTVSDTRIAATDTSGSLIRELLEARGHRVIDHAIVADEPEVVRERVLAFCVRGDCDAVLLTGGTGVAARDTTHETIASILEKRLDGFGELFRMLSYAEIGPAAMLSRAVAGIRGRTAIFSMPGSTPAVRLAMEKLILPEIAHLTGLLRKEGRN
jgi:molybdenum cofactor biosynthesis protein B